ILAPHARRVREDEELLLVVGPAVVLDAERLLGSRGLEFGRRNEDRAPPARGVDADQIRTAGLLWLEHSIRAVVEPARATDGLSPELWREDALDGERRLRGALTWCGSQNDAEMSGQGHYAEPKSQHG